MPGRRGRTAPLPRLVVSADFERVLGLRSRAATRALRRAPSRGAAVAPPRRPERPSAPKLSTIESPASALPVDDLPADGPPPARSWVGAVVPKRHARRAVTRSLLKRQIYAAAERHRHRLAPGPVDCAPALALRPRRSSRARHRRRLRRCARAELDDAAARAARRRCRVAMSVAGRRRALIGAVRGYRFFLSPWLGSACRFEPTCSAYALEALERHGAAAGAGADASAGSARCHPWCAGGLDPVPAAPPRLFTALLGRAPRGRPHARVFRTDVMTDIRRTLLWGVFLASLFFIWDAWNRHNGQPSMFGPPPRVAHRAAPPPPRRARAAADARARRRPARGRRRRRRLPIAAAPVARRARRRRRRRASEQVTVTTDLVRATIDSTGGDAGPRRAAEAGRPARPRRRTSCCSTARASRLYLAADRPRAAGGRRRPAQPPHADARRCRASARSAPGQNELKVAFESEPVGGVKLVKTYTFRRGDYVIDVQHEIVNASTAPVSPQPVPAAGARRQPAAGRVELLLHLHRPGDLHRDLASSRRSTSATSRSAARRQARPRDQRRERLGRDGAALLRRRPG